MMRNKNKDFYGGHSSRSPGGIVPAPGRTTPVAPGPGGYGEGLAGELPTGSPAAYTTVRSLEENKKEKRDALSSKVWKEHSDPTNEEIAAMFNYDPGLNFIEDSGRITSKFPELPLPQVRRKTTRCLLRGIGGLDQIPDEGLRYRCYVGIMVAVRALRYIEKEFREERGSSLRKIASLREELASIRQYKKLNILETKENPKCPGTEECIVRSDEEPPLPPESKGDISTTRRIAFNKQNCEVCESKRKMEVVLREVEYGTSRETAKLLL